MIVTANVIHKSMADKYLSELDKDETTIREAAEAYETAKAQLDMSLTRYVALRNFVTEQLGKSPYSSGVEWPGDGWTEAQEGWSPVRGQFRYTGMKPGDAIAQVLEERSRQEWKGAWMTLDEIIAELSEGGLGFPEPVQARAVNAATIHLTGVIHGQRPNDDAKYYRYGGGKDNADIDVDDLPFE